ncbi:SLC13 family permease [Pseudomonas sp. F01002]|uniref:SLC13 family permease n=1 Tax=Pseudomonas sp. F01002 TaxID=2555724 RepID=UPI0021151284|nr:SLC13 family permease [Pseudomonas sp. F01002]
MHDQRRRISAHAPTALNQIAIFLAAGILAGILSGTGMANAMPASFLPMLPETWGPYMAPITAVASIPGTFFMSNDAFYYGAHLNLSAHHVLALRGLEGDLAGRIRFTREW